MPDTDIFCPVSPERGKGRYETFLHNVMICMEDKSTWLRLSGSFVTFSGKYEFLLFAVPFHGEKGVRL